MDESDVCPYCERRFTAKKNLLRHIRNVHEVEPEVKKTIQCPNCEILFRSRNEMRDHLHFTHNIEQEQESHEFLTHEAFKMWKENVEQKTFNMYVQITGSRSSQNGKKSSFYCHRSGDFKSKSTGKRQLKSQGTNKIGKCCPASMDVFTATNGEVKVTFWKTHVGHTNELGRVVLPKSGKTVISNKISSGVPFHRILDSVRMEQTELNRMALLEYNDLWNIKRFVDASSANSHSNDVVSVNLFLSQLRLLEPSPVLFYKEQNIEDPKGFLQEQDIMIIIMTDYQQQLISKFGQNKICIDSTHGTNKYDFELVTLLTIDEYSEGCPVAFCITNRIDSCAIGLFFTVLKEAVGLITTEVFMSDDAPAFINAWSSIMSVPKHRLLCSWHVCKSLKENLNKIKNAEKRKNVEEVVDVIRNEGNVDKFEDMLKSFIEDLGSDVDMQSYCAYFEKYYSPRKVEWAACYRIKLGINTNMHLEAFHRVLKYCYLDGKKNRRLDVCLRSLLKFSRDKVFNRIIKITKKKKPACHKAIKRSHNKAKLYEKEKIISVSEGTYNVPSETKSSVFYTVQKEDIQQNCICALTCADCSICIHMYSCSCLDYLIRYNLCKHIHACVLLDKNEIEEVPSATQPSFEENALVERENVSALFEIAKSQRIEKNQEIESLATTIINLSQSCSTLDEKEHSKVSSHLKAAISILEKNLDGRKGNLRPPNVNVDQQRRFKSTKRKRNTPHTVTHPDPVRSLQIAANLLGETSEEFVDDPLQHDHTY